MTSRRLAVGIFVLVGIVAAAGVAAAAPTASATFSYGGDALTLHAGADQTVRGEATLPPGSTLIVRIRSTGEDRFMVSKTTTVADDGTFAATFDLRGVGTPTTVTVAAYRDGTRISDATRGRIVSAPPTPSPGVDTKRPGSTTGPEQLGFGVVVGLAGIGTGLLARRLL